jgi:hypothetical protein
MDIRIGKHGWVQVGGDMNPGTYGGTIARADGRSIEIRQIQPVREYVGDREAVEVGFPFWTKDGYFDLDDLTRDVASARDYAGLTDEILSELKPESRAMAIAEALLSYGRGDEGPGGWAKDVVPGKVKWWGSKNPTGWHYLEDEDREFRQLLRENRSRGMGEYDPSYLRGIQERAAKALGWSLQDVQSMSLASLREQVRPVSPKLAHELTEAIREMGA